MKLNSTLFAQMLVFFILVWFTMKYVWPPILKTLEEREKKITDGLKASEIAHLELEKTKLQINKDLELASNEINKKILDAQHKANLIIEEAKLKAAQEAAYIVENAKKEANLQFQNSRKALLDEFVNTSVELTGLLLKKDINKNEHETYLTKILESLKNGN